MNIFFISKSPHQAARQLCDQHVVKMILESAQLLSMLVRAKYGDKVANRAKLYKKSHPRHPCQLWLQKSDHNWWWLWLHVSSMSREYSRRYGKVHKAFAVADRASTIMFERTKAKLSWTRITPPVQCMPVAYHLPKHKYVRAYRDFYRLDKVVFARWNKGRKRPKWMSKYEN